jgi:hypothetical protein
MNIAVFCDVPLCYSCKNRRFGGTYRLHHQGGKSWHARHVLRLLVTAIVAPSSPILVAVMMEALNFFAVLTELMIHTNFRHICANLNDVFNQFRD